MQMDYQGFASDLPVEGRVHFSSAEESEEVMQRHDVNQQMRQTGKGRFQADCALIETERAIISADRFSTAIQAFYEPPPDTVSMLIIRCVGGPVLASGESVGDDKIVVVPSGYGADLISSELSGSEAIAIPKTKYTELTQALFPSGAQPEGMQISKGDTRVLRDISHSLLRILADAEPCDEEIANLVAHMVICTNYPFPGERPETIYRKQTKIEIAKQAQTYVEEHYHETVSIEDLCRATGKEVRTLQRCFRSYFDSTISDYLKIVRLNAARRELLSVQPDEETVSSIALNNGFTHLGRFSVEYKKHFGESASETLQKRKN